MTWDWQTKELLFVGRLGKLHGEELPEAQLHGVCSIFIGVQFPLWLSWLVNMTIGCDGDFETVKY